MQFIFCGLAKHDSRAGMITRVSALFILLITEALKDGIWSFHAGDNCVSWQNP